MSRQSDLQIVLDFSPTGNSSTNATTPVHGLLCRAECEPTCLEAFAPCRVGRIGSNATSTKESGPNEPIHSFWASLRTTSNCWFSVPIEQPWTFSYCEVSRGCARSWSRAYRCRRPHQLVARRGAAHERHGVTRLQQDGRGPRVHVAEHEPTLVSCCTVLSSTWSVWRWPEARPSITFPIDVGLERAERRDTRVTRRPVVAVHRFLRGDEHAQAQCPRSFHELHERAFGGKVVGGR